MTSRQEPDRKARIRRRKLARKARPLLTDILADQSYFCFHCGCLLTAENPHGEGRSRRFLDFLFIDGWKVFVATIDHMKPIRDGGTSIRENLVASCRPCNARRTGEPRRAHVCIDCGSPHLKTKKRCRSCAIKVWEKRFGVVYKKGMKMGKPWLYTDQVIDASKMIQ